MFQSANEHRDIEIRPTLVNLVLIRCSNCVSNPYLGNVDNSIMDNKQGEMCFYFLDYLCAKWSINNELSLD